MPQYLGDLIRFRSESLFDGAVNLDWFTTDSDRCHAASRAFVFHGPQYHGARQEDTSGLQGHQLIDTASFARSLVRQCYGEDDQPFTLAVAGYGTGKSHLALTLANLLADPKGPDSESILAALHAADPDIASEVRALLKESGRPCLVVALNGMQSFDLTTELGKQIRYQLALHELDITPLEELRPRFNQLATLVQLSNETILSELVHEVDADSVQAVLGALREQNEHVYAMVHEFFSKRGMTIHALGGESARDVIDLVVQQYCGKGKPFRSLLILFDEFGRYTEFATMRSQVAGAGVLQDLFEGIQAHSSDASFVGFIQFDLNTYVQLVAPEYRNEILRYVTRYQSARRVYLSINLETLIANLLEKRKPKLLDQRFDGADAHRESTALLTSLTRWFPQVKNHRLWTDVELFHAVVRKGCWPLAPLSTWFLFYLASAGKHLQQRSALSFLGDAVEAQSTKELDGGMSWSLPPVSLWSEGLQQELLTAEDSGDKGSTAHTFSAIAAKYATQLEGLPYRILCAVMLGSKMEMQCADRADAITAIAALAGTNPADGEQTIRLLEEEFNLLEWDESFRQFQLLGEAVPRTQFLAFLRQRVAATFDEDSKAKLFSRKGREWCELLRDLDECEFAEENRISTKEWAYQAAHSTYEMLPLHVKVAKERWMSAFGVDEVRGTIIYCYLGPNRDADRTAAEVRKLLAQAAKEAGTAALPILVVLLSDEQGVLGQALAEVAILEEGIGAEDRVRFGNLVPAHKEKMLQVVGGEVARMMRERRYCTGLKEELRAQRLSRAGSELFEAIYTSPIPFPFDGFSTAKGNAADTCQELTAELMAGKLDFDAVIAKPVKTRNRAAAVLKDCWAVFAAAGGSVLKRPAQTSLRAISVDWDNRLASTEARLRLGDAMRELCLPPYGANIASAGLILGVYVAPRVGKIAAVRDGRTMAVSELVKDSFFKGKFVDLTALQTVDLIPIGDVSSAWERLLDEWEQAEAHTARLACLQRSEKMKTSVPLPPTLAFREERLRDRALGSRQAIVAREKRQNEALKKIEHGYERDEVVDLAWGAALLVQDAKNMRAESPDWTDAQITEMDPHIERARVAIQNCFVTWLRNQQPKANTPASVGEFQRKLVKHTAQNLRDIGLVDLAGVVEKHVGIVVQHFEAFAEAGQVLRDVGSWLTTNGHAAEHPRVAQLRQLRNVGEDLGMRLQEVSKRVKNKALSDMRGRLADFLTQLKQGELTQTRRSEALWRTKIESEGDIHTLMEEVESLVNVFENVPSDLEDILRMRRVLRQYETDLSHLAQDDLTWPDLDALAQELGSRSTTEIGGGEVPWTPQDVIPVLVAAIAQRRTAASSRWLAGLEVEAQTVAAMSAAEANRLLSRASDPPMVLTTSDHARLQPIVGLIESHLERVAVEWLVEKFKELAPTARARFLAAVSGLGFESVERVG